MRSVMTKGRAGISSPRWSPDGASIAFLAQDDARRVQIFVQPVGGGDMRQLTSVKTAVKQLAWRPDSGALAFAAADETPEKTGEAKFEDGFEIGDNHYLERESRMPTHLWTVSLANGASKRLTHGSWSMSVHLPPAVSEASKISCGPQWAFHRFCPLRDKLYRRQQFGAPGDCRCRKRRDPERGLWSVSAGQPDGFARRAVGALFGLAQQQQMSTRPRLMWRRWNPWRRR